MKINLINTNVGNLNSLKNMLNRVGIIVNIANSKKDLYSENVIILPGVGSFEAAVKNLKVSGIFDLLKDEKFLKDKYLLGICLGMQLLLSESKEGSERGLSLIPGVTEKFDSNFVKVPHMGWNNLIDCSLDYEFLNTKKFYFAHSFYAKCDKNFIKAYSKHSVKFPAIIQNKRVIGIQFHPEKSHQNGIQLLKNILESIKNNAF